MRSPRRAASWAVADGDLTPRDAAQLAAVIQVFARTLGTADLERELEELVKAPG